jgi:hypothetical protein
VPAPGTTQADGIAATAPASGAAPRTGRKRWAIPLAVALVVAVPIVAAVLAPGSGGDEVLFDDFSLSLF